MNDVVTLLSSSGREYRVQKDIASISPLIRRSITATYSFQEVESGKVRLEYVDDHLMELALRFMKREVWKLQLIHISLKLLT